MLTTTLFAITATQFFLGMVTLVLFLEHLDTRNHTNAKAITTRTTQTIVIMAAIEQSLVTTAFVATLLTLCLGVMDVLTEHQNMKTLLPVAITSIFLAFVTSQVLKRWFAKLPQKPHDTRPSKITRIWAIPFFAHIPTLMITAVVAHNTLATKNTLLLIFVTTIVNVICAGFWRDMSFFNSKHLEQVTTLDQLPQATGQDAFANALNACLNVFEHQQFAGGALVLSTKDLPTCARGRLLSIGVAKTRTSRFDIKALETEIRNIFETHKAHVQMFVPNTTKIDHPKLISALGKHILPGGGGNVSAHQNALIRKKHPSLFHFNTTSETTT